MFVHRPAVDVVNEGVDDVSEDEGPGSSQTVLHLPEQQADEQVVHEEDAVTFVAVDRLRRFFTHGQQNLLDGNLKSRKQKGLTEAEKCKTKKVKQWVHETLYRGF